MLSFNTSLEHIALDLVGWLVVFYVPSTAMSFRDGTPIYCPLRRTWSSVDTPFPPGIEPRTVAWQSITPPLRHASSYIALEPILKISIYTVFFNLWIIYNENTKAKIQNKYQLKRCPKRADGIVLSQIKRKYKMAMKVIYVNHVLSKMFTLDFDVTKWVHHYWSQWWSVQLANG